ncbi:cobalamin biosynthesis protein CbiG [Desulfitobacterium dichloroeliminans LMG P-21439]|uniref:Cobalamin biosynthesis protein CbiG n=1 Tax=Desulfitobacterium dichloroeliminans (strain LMG P-21439 / DCA1) TaxID=871963 RepID=L0F401_DESDL|nr:cobalt-precorrin 5A hydrolase [Desulfitobacterium dichloroeliminans]AGA68539.1 cobalamin biosynthesis protein CbiG [Desulfitobacterium dichloroeliminans LMG P-21439]
MKVALVALTGQGLSTARNIVERWSDEEPLKPELWLNQRLKGQYTDGAQTVHPHYFELLKEVVPRIWQSGSLLIFIMATGIVVRQIAPYLQGKDRDPAVLVLDEKGEFVISLLSGHLGGANAWTRTVAQWLDAQPVVTTATDGQGLIAPDEYARQFGWAIEPLAGLKYINRILLEESCLRVWTDCLQEEHPLRQDAAYCFVKDEEKAHAHLWITPRDSQWEKDPIDLCTDKSHPVSLIPRIYSIGVGCRKGASLDQISKAVAQSLRQLGISSQSILGLYSIDLKAEEAGLIETAHHLGVPFRTFSAQQIQELNEKFRLSSSDYVKEMIGVDGVCEAASLLGTKEGELILPKLKLNGVTVAISKERFLS